MSVSAVDSNGQSTLGAGDPRLALLESIRSGKTLKHVEVDGKRPAGVGDSRGELLDQIRQGVELKSVQSTPRPSVNTAPEDGLAGALARALAERARAIHSETSGSSDGGDEEDEWDE
jgi:Wiskott-Aldrich syndrome protein